jgi:hypothetical protein
MQAEECRRVPLRQLWRHLPEENRRRVALRLAGMVAQAAVGQEGGPRDDQ